MPIKLHEILAQIAADRASRRSEMEQPLSKAAQQRLAKQARVLEKAQQDHEFNRKYGRAKAQAKYHAKNREALNRARALRARLPQAVYRRSKHRAEERGQTWEFSFEEWWAMWESAPRVLDIKTGFTRSAWAMRGGNFHHDTQMMRRDTTGPWNVTNCFIGIKGEPL